MLVSRVADPDPGLGIDELNSFPSPNPGTIRDPTSGTQGTGSMLVSSVADPGLGIDELNSFSIPKPRDYPGPNIR
jgi:hypothetical protein